MRRLNENSLLRRAAKTAKVVVGQEIGKPHIQDNSRPVNVFVSGIMGTGEISSFEHLMPYWGLVHGDLLMRLEDEGYECHAATVGPMSSAWDRACELYAQLVGGVVDYGKAHSERYGHTRYGRFYHPLFEGWSEERKINLFGHSFGGNTARMFAELCENGCEMERAATPEGELSPLFRGGFAGWIHSISCLSTPHNGTNAIVTIQEDQPTWPFLPVYTFLTMVGTTPLINGIYDMHLEHFGLSNPGGKFFGNEFSMKRLNAFIKSRDHATADLSLDGAAQLNRKISINPKLYYFSYACDMTVPLSDRRLPHLKGIKEPLTFFYGLQIGLGLGYARKTARLPNGREVTDPIWLQNDGCVPLGSALFPEGEPHVTYDAAAPVTPGTWHVMPIKYGVDHGYYCGWDPNNCEMDELTAFYLGHLRLLESTACGEQSLRAPSGEQSLAATATHNIKN